MNIYPCCEAPFEKRGGLFHWINLNHNTKRKIIMRINLVIFFTLMACLHVTGKVHAQKVSLNVKNAKLSEVLNQIKKQTGYDPFYDSEQIKIAKPITISLKDADLDVALESCLKGQPFTFKILNKTIVISYKSPPIPLNIPDKPQRIIIKGKVTNERDSALAGVSVRIKDTNEGTQTDRNGEYAIEADPNGTIIFSHLGYEAIEIKISAQTVINASLKENTNQLKETIIKGYYNTTRELNTGNVSVVQGADLAKQPVGDPLMALGGRVPGLFVSQTTGVPGGEVKVTLRGKNSLRTGNANNPLYIVDGVPFQSTSLTIGTLAGAAREVSPFSSIKVNDIENVTVLKDADATAIYGSRGANGVILITTKRGKEGKTKFNVNVLRGVGRVSNRLDLMNTAQYVEMRKNAMANDNLTPRSRDRDMNGRYGDPNDLTRFTDFQEVMIGGSAELTDAQLSISGGSTGTKFLLSGGYRRENTVFPGDYNDQKGSIHLNINHQSENKRFEANGTISYTKDNLLLPMADFTQYILLAPNSPALYNENGTLNWQNSAWQNPLWQTIMSSRSVTDNLIGTLNLKYLLYKNLFIGANFGYTDLKLEASTLIPFYNYDPSVPADPSFRSHQFGTTKRKSWIVEPNISYNLKFAGGMVESIVGATFNQYDQHSVSQTATGFASDALIKNVGSASTIKINSADASLYRYSALFARIGYNYENKYLFNVTGRRDGSSRFGPGKQFGNFGAIGAAWIFSQEGIIMRNLTFLSFGKLRASYGIVGNDQIGDYKFLSTYTPLTTTYQGAGGLVPTSLTNPDYRWETVRKLEAGLDMGFAKDRIMVTLSWYKNRTGNQLVGYSLPSITGFTTVQANLPAVLQNTGAEFELNTINIKNQDFSWTIGANFTLPKSKLISYPNFDASPYTTTYRIGEPLNLSYRYHYLGIDPNTGLYSFEDVNQDGVLTSSSDLKPVNIGIQFYGGFSNNISYKGFQLDLFFQFVKQTGNSHNSAVAPGIFFGDGSNQLSTYSDNTNIQKLTAAFGTPADIAYQNFMASDGVLVDQSFVRLKSLFLSWELPQKYLRLIKLQRLKFFIQGQNLFTITNYRGLDPELIGGTTNLQLPTLKMITAGIQLDL